MNLINKYKLFQLINNSSIENKVAQLLTKNQKTISVAESCTGGLISSVLTDISGSSAFVKANFVTYANEAKSKYLKVNRETLVNFGAVSEQTAFEMAKGLIDETQTDYAIVTTGIAGPTGGTEQKPVGLIYIGIASKNTIKVYRYKAKPNVPRKIIKYIFAKQALKYLYEIIKGELK